VLVGGSTFTNEVIEEPSGDHGHIGDFSVLRFGAYGVLERGFGDEGHVDMDVADFDDLADLAVDARGRVVGAGSTRNVVAGGLGPFDIAVWRQRAGGALDPRFGDDGTALVDLGGSERVEAIAIDRAGRVLVAGATGGEDGSRALVLRLGADGRLDPGFGDGGIVIFDELAAFDGVHVDRSGRITLSGQAVVDGSAATAVVGLDDRGAERGGFGDGGISLVRWPSLGPGGSGGLALDRAGRILAATAVADGDSGLIGVVRLGRDGDLDSRWGDAGRALVDLPAANDVVGSLAATPAGELLVAGSGYPADFAWGDGYLAKLTRRGRPDPRFGHDGLVRERFGLDYTALNDVALQPDGRIVAVGWNFAEAPETLPLSDIAVARYLPDGRRDPRFGRRGLVLADVQGAAVCERFENDVDAASRR
jgi:uncharacterized delta-60 repeat protein